MPMYKPTRVEYTIVNGRVSVVADDGTSIPAYWAHPNMGGRFPSVCLLHDWTGITEAERRLAHLLAQLGYYVLIPDLFDGATAITPAEGMALLRLHGDRAYVTVDRALRVLEKHNRTTSSVAVIGFGMGGSLAFEAALNRAEIEAAVAFYGLPMRFFGHFRRAKAPILAIYGADEPVVKPEEIERLRAELVDSPFPNDVLVLKGAARDFFKHGVTGTPDDPDVIAWDKMLAFLDQCVRPLPPAKA